MGSGGLDGKSMADAREALEALAQDRFAFLLSDTGFAKGPSERSAALTAYSYKDKYQTAQLGAQILLDFESAFVEVSLVRLESGKWPKLGERERHGRTARTPLARLLSDTLLVKDARLTLAIELSRLRLPWDAALAAQTLDVSRDLLERYITLILRQPMDVLFPPSGRPRI
jgi:hypothetical protein